MILPHNTLRHYAEMDVLLTNSCTEAVKKNKELMDACIKTFSIVDKAIRQQLDQYYLLYWEPSYLLEILEGDDKSYITRNGIRYYVIYMEMLSPEYLKAYKRIRVSFRKPQTLTYGFVLVRSFREKETM